MARRYQLKSRSAGNTPQIDFAAELNEQQLEAVQAKPGPLLVIAGAGSGKTRTLTYRVAYLLEQGVPADAILLLTFTNKAAREMLQRVDQLLPGQVSGLWGGTFHSVGNRILRRHGNAIGLRRGFTIMDRADQADLLNAVVTELNVKEKGKDWPRVNVLADLYSYAANTQEPLTSVIDKKYPHFMEFAHDFDRVLEGYEQRKLDANCVDFDDLLVKTLQMLRQEPGIAEFYQDRFRHLLVDEYQDTNRVQSEFIDLLAQKHRGIMAVGDDAQSIYSWRGADFRNILEFPRRYADALHLRIETNYRSTPRILELANEAIAPNINQFPKELRAAREASDVKPAIVPLRDGNQQAEFITQRIQELSQDEDVPLSEIAVLYRAHFHSMELEMELIRSGIPYHITSGLRFFEQAHIKDVTAFLRFVHNPADEVSFSRIAGLFQGIGKKGAQNYWSKLAPQLAEFSREIDPNVDPEAEPEGESVEEETEPDRPKFGVIMSEIKAPARAAKQWDRLAEILDMITCSDTGEMPEPADQIATVMNLFYEDYMQKKFTDFSTRQDDVNQLITFAGQYDTLEDLLAELALLGNAEVEPAAGFEDEETGVTLSSIHQAKGLEYRVVFVIWMTEGMFPSYRAVDQLDQLEEERRLFYVAVTRAKDELYLTHPHIRTGKNSRWSADGYGDNFQEPSRFLEDLPMATYEEWEVGGAFF
jgi:DNA helicase-2/ATP-dependent DNA helicase PcrA